MIQSRIKVIFGTALMLGCFGLFSFTTTENSMSTADSSLAAGGPKVTCPEGDMWVCYTIQGGQVWKGRGDATVEY